MLVQAMQPGSTTFLQSIGALWVSVGLTISLQAYGVPAFLAILCAVPLWSLWVYISIPLSVMMTNLCYLCVDLFFRDVTSRNTFKVPKKGPVLFVCAPHSNQLLDPVVVMRTCPRQAGFLCAAKTMRKAIAGTIATALDSIPVERPQDLQRRGQGVVRLDGLRVEGRDTAFTRELSPKDRVEVDGESFSVAEVVSDTELRIGPPLPSDPSSATAAAVAAAPGGDAFVPYSVLPHVDSTQLYEAVIARLGASECVGIFPEGGSHDRTELLPLKMGVAIMALGALARYPGTPLRIVPVGLHYFLGHRFRGSVLVDYGEPLTVPPELVEAYEKGGGDMQRACRELLVLVHKSLAAVTISAPDSSALEFFWMLRRLQTQRAVAQSGQRPTLEEQVALTKAFSEGYDQLARRPSTQQLLTLVAAYNRKLRLLGLKDYQVDKHYGITWRSTARGVVVFLRMIFNSCVALPGLLLGFPLFLATTVIAHRERTRALASSSVKITGRDVVATYKVLTSLVMTPVLHLIYTTAVWWRWDQRAAVAYFFFSPFVCWGAVRCAESSRLALREAWGLVSHAVLPSGRFELARMREEVKDEVLRLVEDMGWLPPSSGSRSSLVPTEDGSAPVTPVEPPEQWVDLCEALRGDRPASGLVRRNPAKGRDAKEA